MLNPTSTSERIPSNIVERLDDPEPGDLIQINISGIDSIHVYNRLGEHTGTLNDTTYEEAIQGSSFIASPPFNIGEPITIVVPKDSNYIIKMYPVADTQQIDFSVYDLSNGQLMRGAFFDSIFIAGTSTALCTLSVINPISVLGIDTNSDGLSDSIITPSIMSDQATDLLLKANWNLVSIPRIVKDSIVLSQFPNAISDAFEYGGIGYIATSALSLGKGYWLKFPTSQTIQINGFYCTTESVTVSSGWNMIGSISEPISTDSITSDPPGIVTSDFFCYSSSYITSDTIYPGQGYWVKVNQDGKLILSSTTESLSKARIKIVPTSEMPPSPPSESTGLIELPKEYRLEQNYPNPFNPITTIKYGLPSPSNVKLRIFNVLGQVVATLKDEEESAGYKQIEWNSSAVASGIYFYRLEATSVSDPSKSFTQVRKMILIK